MKTFFGSWCVILILGTLVIRNVLSLTDLEGGVGIDGFRCDSCGHECSIVCGSRAFRTCCFNYIKKRGDPNLTPKGDPSTSKLSSIRPSEDEGSSLTLVSKAEDEPPHRPAFRELGLRPHPFRLSTLGRDLGLVYSPLASENSLRTGAYSTNGRRWLPVVYNPTGYLQEAATEYERLRNGDEVDGGNPFRLF